MSENVIALRLALNGVSQVTNGLKSVGAAMVAALAGNLTAGNLVRMTDQAIKAADEMGKLAQKSGIAVEALSGLSFAAKMGDLSSEEFANALKFLNQEMARSGRAAQDTDQRMMELADQFAAMPDGPEKTAIAMQNFGRAGIEMIPFLNQGTEAIREQREEAKAFGLVINQQFSENADRFNDNMFRIKSSVQGLFLAVSEKLLPTIIELQERFIDFTKDVAAREAIITGIGEIFKRTALFAAGLAHAFEQVAIWSQFMTPLSEVMRQSDEAFTRLGRLAETLDQIGEANERMSASKPKADFLDPEKMARYSAIMGELNDVFRTLRDEEGRALLVLQERMDRYIATLADNAPNEAAYWAGAEVAFEIHEAEKTRIQKEYSDKRLEIEKREKEVKARLHQQLTRGVSDMFGDMAETAKAFGAKGFAAWKAFATAQALVNTYASAVASFNAMAGIPYIGPALGIAAAAAAIGAGMAQVAAIQSTNPAGFMSGGYTGDGARSEIAGPAHRGEFIFSAPATSQLGVANLAALHDSARGGGGSSVSVGGPNITNAVLFSDADVRQLFKSSALKDTVINIIRLNKMELGLA
jgi:hypothetical protein